MLRPKKQTEFLVSSTPLPGKIIGVVSSSRRFRISDVAGITAALAQEIIVDLSEAGQNMGGNALSGLQFSLVGGAARGEAARSVGHILGWATAVVMEGMPVLPPRPSAPVRRREADTWEDREEPEEPGNTAGEEDAEDSEGSEESEEEEEEESPERTEEPEAPPVPMVSKTERVSLPDDAFLPRTEMARPEPEPSMPVDSDVPRLWKVRTKEGQVYKPAPEEKLIALLKAGKLKPDVEVSDPEGGPWISVLEVPAFSRVLG